MARLSELEQSGQDTLEIAITQSEFDRLGAATDPFELRITLLDQSGGEFDTFMVSTNPVDWTLDASTGEYVLVAPLAGTINHRTDWDGIVVSSTNETGLDTVEDALMIGPFGEAVDADGTLAEQVTSATHISIGTPLTLIDQSVVVGSSGDATLRFDAPDISTPIVARGADLGSSGSGPPICFADGTLIATKKGEIPIGELWVGDLVWTEFNKWQKIRWIGRVTYSADALARDPKKRPVRISKGALGAGLPKSDLLVSRLHRLAVSAPILIDLVGVDTVLLPAHRLTKLAKISLVCPKRDLTYYHLLFGHHEILIANGVPAESLLLAHQTQEFIGAKTLKRISSKTQISCESQERSPVLIPDLKMQKLIVEKLVQNRSLVFAKVRQFEKMPATRHMDA